MAFIAKYMLITLAIISACTANEDSTFSQVKKTNIVITVTNEVTYMPQMMILGFANGTIARCPHATPLSCEIYHVASSPVAATAVHGEFLFVALPSSILRCRWQKKHSCMVFHQTGSQITSLAITAGYIHAGLTNGTITRCELNTPNSCQRLVNLGRNITSLTAFGQFLYTGSDDGIIHRCTELNCTLLCKNEGSELTGLEVVENTIYGVRHGGFLQYGLLNGNSCNEYSVPGGGYRSMGAYDGKLYVVQDPGTVHVINRSNRDISQFAVHKNAVSISFAYGTCAMQDQYKMESKKCIWRGVFQCPPTVVYYDVHERNTWEISVENGSLYNSQGSLVDTATADESYSQKAAIFVMGPDGQILLSNFHKTGLFHTSSLLAGNPVSGAGLMVVNQGKIKKITACSIHYRPDQELNSQVIKALYQKGYTYTDQIDSQSCSYNSMLCVQDSSNIGNQY